MHCNVCDSRKFFHVGIIFKQHAIKMAEDGENRLESAIISSFSFVWWVLSIEFSAQCEWRHSAQHHIASNSGDKQ